MTRLGHWRRKRLVRYGFELHLQGGHAWHQALEMDQFNSQVGVTSLHVSGSTVVIIRAMYMLVYKSMRCRSAPLLIPDS
jgi:hypothetical protein